MYVRKSSDGSAELVLLDHGLYEYIDTSDRVALANFFKAIVLKDEPAMQYHAQRMNVKGWKSCIFSPVLAMYLKEYSLRVMEDCSNFWLMLLLSAALNRGYTLG